MYRTMLDPAKKWQYARGSMRGAWFCLTRGNMLAAFNWSRRAVSQATGAYWCAR